MSYTPVPNYYGAAPNSHNNQQRYVAPGDGVSRSQVYHTPMRDVNASQQGQYTTHPYGWASNTQNNSVANNQSTYPSEQWQDRSDASGSYGYSRGTYAQPEQRNVNAQAYQSRDTYSSQNTQGLNHLAYASGLEPAAPTNANARAASQSTTAYTSSVASNSLLRTSSPAYHNGQPSATPVTQQTPNMYSTTNTGVSSSVNSHDQALNAAAALAGAVRARHIPPTQQPKNMSTMRGSTSPMIYNAQPAPQNVKQTKSSSNQSHPASQHGRKSSGQPHPISSARAGSESQSRPRHTIETAQSAEQRSRAKASVAQTESQSNSSANSTQQAMTLSNPQSIANLVSSVEDSEPQVFGSVESQEAMPHYIDPTQVFNPYHKEHERKKREAAAAEAQRKVEQERKAAEANSASAEAAKQAREPSTAANSKSKITKKAPATTSIPDVSKSSHPSADLASPPPDGNMALEMQKMVSRMKELRNYNPSLFQKLWSEMRGAGPGSAPAAPAVPAATASPSPQIVQASLATDSVKTTGPAKPKSKKSGGKDQPAGVPLNGYKVVVENNPENLPDLGRFPAERRVRVSYGSTKQRREALREDVTTNTTPSIVSEPALGPVLPDTVQASAPPPSNVPVIVVPADNGPWPEPRRRAIAIAAIHLLRANPANASITINPQDICSMLERNPSYLDLCAALEMRGLKFHRASFARELLKNVPELHTSASKTSAPAQQEVATISAVAQGKFAPPQSASAIPVGPEMTTPQPVVELQSGPYVAPNLSHASPTSLGLAKVEGEVSRTASKQTPKASKARASQSNRQEPPMGSKEAAARKRDFAELIDLTEIGDDENYVLPPTKQQKVDNTPTVDNGFEQLGTTSRTSFDNVTAQPLRFNPQPQPLPQPSIGVPQASQQQQLRQHGHQSHLEAAQQQTSQQVTQQINQQNNSKARMFLAKKLDKSEALQKSYYDPRTVARDILIASGRHPGERSLNLHFAGMINLHIELESDLTTFDWDAIDPGGPPPPKVDYVDVPAAPPRFRLSERVSKRRRMVDVEQSRASGAETRGKPEARQLRPTSQNPAPSTPKRSPAPLTKQNPASSTHKSQDDLNRKLVYRQSREVTDPAPSNNSPGLSSASQKISIDIPQITSSFQKSIRRATDQLIASASKMDTEPPSTGKRRGRPPGSKNKNPSVAAMKRQAQATVSEPKPDTKPNEGPEPFIRTFKCKWVKCHAELHNTDILKRHVFRTHGPGEANDENSGYMCWWKNCRYLKSDDSNHLAPGHIFEDREQWIRHIEKDHIEPIAMKYGDGPKTTHTGKQTLQELDLSKFLYKPCTDPQSVELARQRYLADTEGRATTPLVSSDGNSDQPHDAMNLIQAYPQGPKTEKEKADVAAQNAFMRAHGNRHKDGRKAAEEVIRAMEVRKQKIGPGIDRGGCTLVNEARRSTFVQAPGISRIVDYQY